MRTAIVTGATGFIGSRLALKLLKHDWIVHVLGRTKNGIPLETRIIHAIDDITGVPEKRTLFKNLYSHDIDFGNSDMAIQHLIQNHNLSSGALLFNVAGDTRFNPSNPQTQFNINVNGPLNIIRALKDQIVKVIHVSTAYVAGKRKGLILESDLDEGQELRNNYEKSKLTAEIEVTRLCHELGIPLSVTRPSIIINDSITGRSPTLTHLNALIYVVTQIQKHFKAHKSESPKNELRIPINPNSYPNLAPVDPIVDALLEIGTSSDAPGKTFHLCHPSPQPNSEITEILSEAFKIKDIIRLTFVNKIPEDCSYSEAIMFRSLKLYFPYLNEYCEFDLTNTRSIVPGYDSRFPLVTPDYIEKVIYYQRHRQLRQNHKGQ